MNLNKVILVGRVTKDPEQKALPSGIAISTFSLATNKVYTDKNSEKQETAEFHNILFFGKQAEVVGSYVKKGYLLLVEGRLQTRSWEDKETGKKMYRTEIVGESLQLPPKSLSPQSDADRQYDEIDSQDKPNYSKRPAQAARPKADDPIEYPEDEINPEDIPF